MTDRSNDPYYDPDAKAIADSTLVTLPDNHPDKDNLVDPAELGHGESAAPTYGEAAAEQAAEALEAGSTDVIPNRPHMPTGPGAETPAEPASDEYSDMTREELESAADDADVDYATGGSLADGSMSVDELREALRKADQE